MFFSIKKTIHRKLNINGLKSEYENYEDFHEFITKCSTLSHLLLGDIEAGLRYIEDKYVFGDDKVA